MPVSTLLSTFNGRMPKYRCAMVMKVLGQRRHDRAHDDTGHFVRVERAMLEQLRDPDADLVGRPLAQRCQPPALDEPLALEHAEHDVRVADVDR